jgi:hypothetical protein
MRISVSGTACLGKSTLIRDFINTWPNYKTPSDDYRKILKEKNYPHSKKCNKEGQWAILNHMIDEMQKYSKEDKIIFDRCPWDVLVYSLWSCEMGASDIDEKFISQLIPLVKESLKYLDLIFFIPMTKHSQIPIVDDGFRETDPQYIAEIDNIFKALFYEYQHSLGKTPFFSPDDSPAIIEVFGKPQERILLIQQYLDVNGEVIGEDADSILNPNNIEELEKLVMEQMSADEKEKYLKKQKQLINDFEKQEKKLKKTRVS